MNYDKNEKVLGLNHKYIKKTTVVGYCGFHKVSLRQKDLKDRECLSKHCDALVRKKSHSYWKERDRSKQLRKARKERLRRTI